jgi:hypothetical protein
MSGAPAILMRPEHRSGTTWEGMFRFLRRVDGVVTDLTGATARLVWSTSDGEVLATWEIGAGIEVPTPADGYLYVAGPTMPPATPGAPFAMIDGVLTAPAGVLRGELIITLASGEVTEPLEILLPVSVGVGV